MNSEITIHSLMIRANMGIGKTKQLEKLVKKDKKVIIILFRRSLCKTTSSLFDGFQLYSDIEPEFIDLNIYNKIVSQIDSIHRVFGEADLLVLDEFTYY